MSLRALAYFYPRSPCGERLLERFAGVPQVDISIHALLAESDGGAPVHEIGQEFISIHALLAESDSRTPSARPGT